MFGSPAFAGIQEKIVDQVRPSCNQDADSVMNAFPT